MMKMSRRRSSAAPKDMHYVEQIVRVVKQPPNQWVQIEGEVGWIKAIHNADIAMAEIETLKLDGSCGGCGAVPLNCLAPENGLQWKAAFEQEKARRETYLDSCRKAATRFIEHIEKVAAKHGIPYEEAKAIFDEIHAECHC